MAMYIPWFAGWADYTPTTPKMYWDVKSQEQRIHMLMGEIHKLICYSDTQTEQINKNTAEIEKLIADFDKFKESGFLDYYEELLNAWLVANGPDIVERLFGFAVYFGLNDNGHFVAYSPETWEDITFDTGAVYGSENYGRLMLSY